MYFSMQSKEFRIYYPIKRNDVHSNFEEHQERTNHYWKIPMFETNEVLFSQVFFSFS